MFFIKAILVFLSLSAQKCQNALISAWSFTSNRTTLNKLNSPKIYILKGFRGFVSCRYVKKVELVTPLRFEVYRAYHDRLVLGVVVVEERRGLVVRRRAWK